ncbi:cytochrome b561 [Wenyingzhuangia heitensis]|uniref:Cytochrome b561 n=1 Tax=Wenyingzhuangia heitensis TaxID=1487859 RepID=A0ABX0U911_9FLAO|nr:DUF4405 domain-containing protein [Wenyingzhuangia heitensis]NIJ45233.1 cytochrome b561 [Wenyingzhuangia heitensis]
MNTTPNKKKTSKVRIYTDIFFFALMILVLVPQTTGIPIHEWFSFLILLPFFLHIIINWSWIVTNSSKLLKKQHKSRFDYILNWILYLFMIVVTVSGIVISEAALPFFGIYFEPDPFWSKIHNLSATLLMVVLGVHICLHWKWILGAIKKLKFKTDLHHLSEIKTILITKAKSLLFLVFISIVIAFAFWALDDSEWANGFRINLETETVKKENNLPKNGLRYILPFVKVAVLMTIPALITGGIIKLKKRIRKR